MGGGPASDDSDLHMASDGSVVVVSRRRSPAPAESCRLVRPLADCSLSSSPLAAQLWCKSAVYVHPTSYTSDNVCGFAAVVERDRRPLLCWLPTSLLLDDEREQFLQVETAQNGTLEALALAEEGAFRAPA
jgi:hypothetical protein